MGKYEVGKSGKKGRAFHLFGKESGIECCSSSFDCSVQARSLCVTVFQVRIERCLRRFTEIGKILKRSENQAKIAGKKAKEGVIFLGILPT